MSLETIIADLDKKIEAQVKKEEDNPYLNLDELPDSIDLAVRDVEWKSDNQKNECCYVTYGTKEGKLVKQKYTITMYPELRKRFNVIGASELSNFHSYTKQRVGRGIFPRFFPVV